MDIVVWLWSLGLGQYEAAFRQNDIDETVLPNLTAEDLKDLGVGIVGIVASSSMLSPLCGAMRETKRPLLTRRPRLAPQAASPEDRAERRRVTVMFSDLVGSTALSARMDPEDRARLCQINPGSLAMLAAMRRVELGTWNFLHYDGCGVAPSCAILPMFTQPRHTSVRGFSFVRLTWRPRYLPLYCAR